MQLHDLRLATLILLVSTASVWAAPPAALNASNALQQPDSSDANLTLPLTVALPHNLTTSPVPLSFGTLPPDPFFYPVPESSGILLEFSHYGDAIDDRHAAIRAIAAARLETSLHNPDTRMFVYRSWNHGNVDLYFDPERAMTWEMFASVIRGLDFFVTMYQYVDLEFEVELAGMKMGFGRFYAMD